MDQYDPEILPGTTGVFFIDVRQNQIDIGRSWRDIGRCTRVSSEKLPTCEDNTEVCDLWFIGAHLNANILVSGHMSQSMPMRTWLNVIALQIAWLLVIFQTTTRRKSLSKV